MIDEMIARVQVLRRQSSEMQGKLSRIQTELDALNNEIRKALDVTGEQYGDWLMAELLRNGVKAGVVNDARGAIEDDHLRARGFWRYLDHPVMKRTLYNRAPICFSKTPLELRTAAPLMGQDTREILTGMLGYTIEEVDRLKAEDVLT